MDGVTPRFKAGSLCMIRSRTDDGPYDAQLVNKIVTLTQLDAFAIGQWFWETDPPCEIWIGPGGYRTTTGDWLEFGVNTVFIGENSLQLIRGPGIEVGPGIVHIDLFCEGGNVFDLLKAIDQCA